MFEDPANCVINTVASSLKLAFMSGGAQPPIGGGTSMVRLFAGEALPIQAWDFFRGDADAGCDEPFVWVRLMRRYRTNNFPTPYVGGDPCPMPVVIAVEIGVARCAAISVGGGECDSTCFENEAEISIDDSMRIERALCHAAGMMRKDQCAPLIGLDAILPYGPDGGVIAWTGILYAQLGE